MSRDRSNQTHTANVHFLIFAHSMLIACFICCTKIIPALALVDDHVYQYFMISVFAIHTCILFSLVKWHLLIPATVLVYMVEPYIGYVTDILLSVKNDIIKQLSEVTLKTYFLLVALAILVINYLQGGVVNTFLKEMFKILTRKDGPVVRRREVRKIKQRMHRKKRRSIREIRYGRYWR